MKYSFHRSLLTGVLALGASTLFTVAPFAQPVATQPPAPARPTVAPVEATIAPSPNTSSAKVSSPAASDVGASDAIAGSTKVSDAIAININGRTVDADPTPVLNKGSVFVPLRGVLESLGAKVTYEAATSRIDILRGAQQYSLRPGQKSAISGAQIVSLPTAPVLINGRAFVPLRALAELFGYRVQWLADARTVAIASNEKEVTPVIATITDHRAALALAGRFGVGINFHDAAPNEVEPLLDAAKNAGATLIKFRFDWNALEPQKGGAFQWPLYDRIVREARERGLTVVGVLGNTPRWATRLTNSKNTLEWRNTAPLAKELPAWENYVRRVIGRYRNDVQAWQVWENPATYNFRAGEAKDYRIVARRAADIAHEVDSGSIVLAAEPGGVNLGFVGEMERNGLLSHVDGVALYPVSQWQPGVIAQPEEALLPVATLMKGSRTKPLGRRDDEYWVGGLSRLSLEAADLQGDRAEQVFRTKDHDLRRRLAQAFTPTAQADYLVRSMTLSLASGVSKIFWADLSDEPAYDLVDPVNSLYGNGLLRPDMTPRPSLAAYSTLTRLLSGKRYVGAISAGPRVVILAFEDSKKDEGCAVVWAIPGMGESKLVLNPERDPEVPGSIFLATRPDSKLLDSTGTEVGSAAGAFNVTSRPLWVTQLSFKTLQDLRDRLEGKAAPSPLRVASNETSEISASGLRAVFAPGAADAQDGLYWKKYLGFRGAAFEFKTVEEQSGLMTTFSRDVYNPAAGQPYIYFDVANNYLYFAGGVPVRVTVEVKRPMKTEGPFGSKGGFNIQYDSPTGFKTTPWQTVEGGEGWATYTIDIPDASFANRDGYDLLINTWGSRQDLVFHSLGLRRLETRDARAADEGSTQ